jgi:hypothetical protein
MAALHLGVVKAIPCIPIASLVKHISQSTKQPMKDGMSKAMKLFCAEVKSFYTNELIYFPEFMPKPGDYNQVYFPYCKYTLDLDGLIAWLKSDEVTEEQLEWLEFTLFNKDKQAVYSQLLN